MTFSIVGFCPLTNRIGVGIATKFIAVGGLALERRYGVGLCCTQAYINPLYRLWTLDGLEAGLSPVDALNASFKHDPYSELRQVILVNEDGQFALRTGSKVDGESGEYFGNDFVVAGNMLANSGVIKAMVKAYIHGKEVELPLERRLISALEAGYTSGGDKRGLKSACLQVYGKQPYPEIDLRIDSDPNALSKLSSLLDEFDSSYKKILHSLASIENPGGSIGLDRLK